MQLPFGFGAMPMNNKSGTPLTRQQQFKNLGRLVQGGIRAGGMYDGGMGAMMGFMNLPWLSRNFAGNGSGSGPMQRISAYDFLNYPFGALGGYGGGKNKPDDGTDNGTNNGGGTDDGTGTDPATALALLYPPATSTGAQWRNTMRYGA